MAALVTSLPKAIIRKYQSVQTAGSAYALTGGRFYNNEGPQSAAFPYLTFFIVTLDHSLILTPKDHDTARVQFSAFSDDRSSPLEMYGIIAAVQTLFDEATLDFTSSSNDFVSVKVKRETQTYQKIDDVWQGTVDYLMTCQEA